MEQFIAVALAHFLALLIPGVDFFLIARTAFSSGWRIATGVCVGISTANALLIAAAFSGVSFISHPAILLILQVGGGIFLSYIGAAFMASKRRFTPVSLPSASASTWMKNFRLGLASGLLNPKNVLFYLSLATALSGASSLVLLAYGTWMFGIVLVWDLLVAFALGARLTLSRLGGAVYVLTKLAGAFLLVFGIGMIATAFWQPSPF